MTRQIIKSEFSSSDPADIVNKYVANIAASVQTRLGGFLNINGNQPNIKISRLAEALTYASDNGDSFSIASALSSDHLDEDLD